MSVTMRRMYKRERAAINAFCARVNALAAEMGARPGTKWAESYPWEIDTGAGVYRFGPDNKDFCGAPSLFTVFGCFDDSVLASALVRSEWGPTHWSGKWNHHLGLVTNHLTDQNLSRTRKYPEIRSSHLTDRSDGLSCT